MQICYQPTTSEADEASYSGKQFPAHNVNFFLVKLSVKYFAFDVTIDDDDVDVSVVPFQRLAELVARVDSVADSRTTSGVSGERQEHRRRERACPQRSLS